MWRLKSLLPILSVLHVYFTSFLHQQHNFCCPHVWAALLNLALSKHDEEQQNLISLNARNHLTTCFICCIINSSLEKCKWHCFASWIMEVEKKKKTRSDLDDGSPESLFPACVSGLPYLGGHRERNTDTLRPHFTTLDTCNAVLCTQDTNLSCVSIRLEYMGRTWLHVALCEK